LPLCELQEFDRGIILTTVRVLRNVEASMGEEEENISER
jgi:hypothetical protein